MIILCNVISSCTHSEWQLTVGMWKIEDDLTRCFGKIFSNVGVYDKKEKTISKNSSHTTH